MPSSAGAVLFGSFGPMKFLRSSCARPFEAPLERFAAGRRRSGRADSTSAATPAAFGADIDVPWSQPKDCPRNEKQAELKIEEANGSVQISPLSESAPNEPQPP